MFTEDSKQETSGIMSLVAVRVEVDHVGNSEVLLMKKSIYLQGFVFVCAVLDIESKAVCMVEKFSAMELHQLLV